MLNSKYDKNVRNFLSKDKCVHKKIFQQIIIIIIIIIQKGWKCKAGRKRLTHYQDLSTEILTRE